MDPTDLGDIASATGDIASGAIDGGADLALFPPDIPGDVMAPSFDFTQNYLQDPVSGFYDPSGTPVQIQAVDGTQANLINGQTMPTSTEDAIAYSATDGSYTPSFNPDATGIPNATPATSGGTVAAAAGSGSVNAWMHGITDAATSLVKVGVAVDTLSKTANPTQTASTNNPNVPQGALRAPLLGAAPTVRQGPTSQGAFTNLFGSLAAPPGASSGAISPIVLIAGIAIIAGLALSHS